MSKIDEINNEIEKIKSKSTFSMQDVQALAMLWGASQVLIEKGSETPQKEELKDIFPALSKYQNEHTTENLKKLCVEIKEFCKSVYASTRNEEEAAIYKDMINKL